MVTEELTAYAKTFEQRAEELRKLNNIDWPAVRANQLTAKKLREIAEGIEEEIAASYKPSESDKGKKCPFAFSDPCGDRSEECRGEECMLAMKFDGYAFCAIAMIGLLGAQPNGHNAKISGKKISGKED